MKAHFLQVHWGRVLLTGVLVAILVLILNRGSLWLASSTASWLHPELLLIVVWVASWSTSILVLLLTLGGAVWVARTVEREAPLHGLLVGLVVALMLFLLDSLVTIFFLGAKNVRLDLILLTFVLTVAAGWLGGVLGSQGREKS